MVRKKLKEDGQEQPQSQTEKTTSCCISLCYMERGVKCRRLWVFEQMANAVIFLKKKTKKNLHIH